MGRLLHLPTCVVGLGKELGKLKAEIAEDHLEVIAQAKVVIQAQKTGTLRRRLLTLMQKALAYHRLRYVGRQRIV